MNKDEFIDILQERQSVTNLNRQDLIEVFNLIFKTIFQETTPAKTITFRNYGTFYLAKHKPTVRNGTYGSNKTNKGYYILKFRASPMNRDELKEDD